MFGIPSSSGRGFEGGPSWVAPESALTLDPPSDKEMCSLRNGGPEDSEYTVNMKAIFIDFRYTPKMTQVSNSTQTFSFPTEFSPLLSPPPIWDEPLEFKIIPGETNSELLCHWKRHRWSRKQ